MSMSIDRRTLVTAGLAAAVTTPAAAAAALSDYKGRFTAAYAEFERFVRPHSETYWASHNRAAANAFAHERASKVH